MPCISEGLTMKFRKMAYDGEQQYLESEVSVEFITPEEISATSAAKIHVLISGNTPSFSFEKCPAPSSLKEVLEGLFAKIMGMLIARAELKVKHYKWLLDGDITL